MEMQIGKTYDVIVLKLTNFGAIVEMPDNSTEVLHISNIANAFIKNASDYLSEGDRLTATAVQGKVKPVELSTVELNLQPTYKKSNTSYASNRYDSDDRPRSKNRTRKSSY